MANTANMVYTGGGGPTGTLQVLHEAGPGAQGQALEGIISFTGDGTTSTVTVNFIDGTAALSFTPSGVIATRSGGAGTSTISALGVGSITATSCVLTASATFTAAVYVFAIRILK